jgi:predicted ArsR family transcriptional regulator
MPASGSPAGARDRADGVGPAAGHPGRREQVLRELRLAAVPVGIAELADRLGVHPNTVRFHLDKLVDGGRVERVRGGTPATGRPPQLYRPVRGMDPTGPRHFRLLAQVLVEALSAHPEPEAEAARAGREWGRARAQAHRPDEEPGAPSDKLVLLMDELGFDPEVSPPRDGEAGTPWMGLRSCPFLELATDRPGIVCPVHLGIMQGALEGWQADVTVDRLDPFVQPDLCLAHLAPVGA